MLNVTMNITVVNESGLEAALQGLSFNKKCSLDAMYNAALKLASHDGGHNKFLESIILWVEVQAPRFWWQEGDTYRISTKQSESTMHTLVKELQSIDESEIRKYIAANFDDGVASVDTLKTMHMIANDRTAPSETETERLVHLKRLMPEGFLQKRLWCFSYKTFRNMVLQRQNHRLPHWPKFIKQVVAQIKHPELLGIENMFEIGHH